MNPPKVGDVAEGTVVKVFPRYAILLFDDGWTGLLHISELSNNYVMNFSRYVSTGNIYPVKVIDVDMERNNVKVSLKQMSSSDRRKAGAKKKIDVSETSFEELERRLPEWIKAINEGDCL